MVERVSCRIFNRGKQRMLGIKEVRYVAWIGRGRSEDDDEVRQGRCRRRSAG
jgi:hypothetical protein